MPGKGREKRFLSVVSEPQVKMAGISAEETPSTKHNHLSKGNQSLATTFPLKLCLALLPGGCVHYIESVFQIKKTDGWFVLCSKLWVDF
jgi:hypothetical protein